MKRVFVIVLDSLGIGAMEDAASYGDAGANTLAHISQAAGGLRIPHLLSLGMGELCPLPGTALPKRFSGRVMAMNEKSRGKDTMTGHWEMMGLETRAPFLTFTETGFPDRLISQLEARTGRKIIGNKSASGTEILDELGERQTETGELIVYTSADSVLQICGNEETMGLEELYRCCEIARELTMAEEWNVGRVIARPYIGRKKGQFTRTSHRRDYAVPPFGKTVLDALKEAALDVIGVGKIGDIFSMQGLTESYHSDSSVHGMEQTIDLARRDFHGLCFVNLVDFDALWGHRRDPLGYAGELQRFDEKLGKLLPLLGKEDLLFLTADHGNDPTHTGTDHTRERVPLLAFSPALSAPGRVLSARSAFADLGATIAGLFQVPCPQNTIGAPIGELLEELRPGGPQKSGPPEAIKG